MKARYLIASGILFAALANVAMSIPAQAKTEKQCAAEWKQMKAAKQTAGKKRKDFITQCRGVGASPAAMAKTPPAAAAAAKPTAKRTTKRTATAPVVSGNVVFPSAVSAKYSSESPGKARMHTCRDQYRANKATGGNGGLKWIQKGDGYYSECNKHLKG